MEIQSVLNTLATNQFLTGGAILGAATGVMYWLRDIPGRVWNFARKYVYYDITIYESTAEYDAVMAFIRNNEYTKKLKQFIYVDHSRIATGEHYVSGPMTLHGKTNHVFDDIAEKYDAYHNTEILPAAGTHIIKFEGKRFVFDFTYTRNERDKGNLMIQIKISFFGRNTKKFERLLAEGKKLHLDSIRQCEIIPHYVAVGNDWNKKVLKSRNFSDIVLSEDIKLLEDIKKFIKNKETYEKFNVSYKRGYCFYGEPGNGKTSTAVALANEFKLPVYEMSLSGMSKDDFNSVVSGINHNRYIILLEDFDCAFKQRESTGDDKESPLTFSDVLNFIDGAGSDCNGRILVVTTNNRDAIDPAMLRSGRLDKHIEFRNPNEEQVRKYYRKFFNEGEDDFIKAIELSKNKIGSFNMADLQVYLLDNHEDYKMAISNIKELKTH